MNERRVYFGRHLRVVRPEDEIQGPITRLGLRDHFNFVSQRQILFAIAAKLVLLSVILWAMSKY